MQVAGCNFSHVWYPDSCPSPLQRQSPTCIPQGPGSHKLRHHIKIAYVYPFPAGGTDNVRLQGAYEIDGKHPSGQPRGPVWGEQVMRRSGGNESIQAEKWELPFERSGSLHWTEHDAAWDAFYVSFSDAPGLLLLSGFPLLSLLFCKVPLAPDHLIRFTHF